MQWLTKNKVSKEITELTNEELEIAVEVSSNRSVNLIILISRYQALKDKVNFYTYCVENMKDVNLYIEELQATMLQVMCSSNGKLSTIGIKDFGDLTVNQAKKLVTSPIDSKLIQSNMAWQIGFKDPEKAVNYIDNPKLNINGMTSSEYLDLQQVIDYNMSPSQRASLIKLIDLNIDKLKLSYSEWKIRTTRLVEEAKSRSLSPQLAESYVERCNVLFI